jgi:hypothetical protein
VVTNILGGTTASIFRVELTSTLKMMQQVPSKTWMTTFETTCLINQNTAILILHHCENIKSYQIPFITDNFILVPCYLLAFLHATCCLKTFKGFKKQLGCKMANN